MTYSEAAKQALLDLERERVSWGDPELLDHIAKLTGREEGHPLVRHQRILNALDKSPEWKKGYTRYHRKVRHFTLSTP